ncbi:type I-E CRISPR-associated protein Cas5/CasD [Stackebrandtia endophytica]|nr:type I-E CRISPR-associated protein Cas5/CasD [Stackebrandtia endophytica]
MLIRLAGPMQSWGEHGVFGERDTIDFPTRSGLLGLLAAAAGISRGQSLGGLTDLEFTIRVDRPGVRLIDFHTIGGNYPIGRGIPTAGGGRKKSAILTQRHYLTDAVFTVACEGPDDVVVKAARSLEFPYWQPFLGRRSCPPEQPMLLGVFDDAQARLRDVPLPRFRPGQADTVRVDFIGSAAPNDPHATTEVRDDCDSFPRRDRQYRIRHVIKSTEDLPVDLCAGGPDSYREALGRFISGGAA